MHEVARKRDQGVEHLLCSAGGLRQDNGPRHTILDVLVLGGRVAQVLLQRNVMAECVALKSKPESLTHANNLHAPPSALSQ